MHCGVWVLCEQWKLRVQELPMHCGVWVLYEQWKLRVQELPMQCGGVCVV